MAILGSKELYVETIYILSMGSDKVRAKDISSLLGFSRASVSRAVLSLKEKGLVRKDTNGNIKLTEGGLILAKHIHERQTLVKDLLTGLGVSDDTASEEASHIERFFSDETVEKIRLHLTRGPRQG